MRTRCALIVLFTMLSFVWLPQLSHAQDVQQTSSVVGDVGIGARIGGYRFRTLSEEGNLSWSACPMDGVGMFATIDLWRHFYLEFSTDMYHGTAPLLNLDSDRLSLHTQLLAGLRMLPDAIISPHFHLGGGLEYTWVRVEDNRATALFPVALMGVGGELNFGRMHFGATIRAHLMQLPTQPQYRPSSALAGATGQSTEGVSFESEVAGGMIFTARYTF